MRVVIQRVSQAAVEIDGKTVGAIKKGVLLLLGIEDRDSFTDIDWLCRKIINLRIFNDETGKMNHSLMDVNGEALVVSQFTLHASTKKGNRPSYIKAAHPDKATPLYEAFLKELEQQLGKNIPSGAFGAMMEVSLVNSGPVTILLDSQNKA